MFSKLFLLPLKLEGVEACLLQKLEGFGDASFLTKFPSQACDDEFRFALVTLFCRKQVSQRSLSGLVCWDPAVNFHQAHTDTRIRHTIKKSELARPTCRLTLVSFPIERKQFIESRHTVVSDECRES